MKPTSVHRLASAIRAACIVLVAAASAAQILGGVVYLSTSDGRNPNDHRLELKVVRRQENQAGKILAAIDPTDELWFDRNCVAYHYSGQKLLAGATAAPAARISGMRRGNKIFLLVADYRKPPGKKTVTVTLPVKVESRVVDLETGRELTALKPGRASFTVDLDTDLARAFCIEPNS